MVLVPANSQTEEKKAEASPNILNSNSVDEMGLSPEIQPDPPQVVPTSPGINPDLLSKYPETKEEAIELFKVLHEQAEVARKTLENFNAYIDDVMIPFVGVGQWEGDRLKTIKGDGGHFSDGTNVFQIVYEPKGVTPYKSIRIRSTVSFKRSDGKPSHSLSLKKARSMGYAINEGGR